MLFHPSAETLEGYKKIWNSSEFYTSDSFKHEYEKHLTAMQHIAACAKIYVIDNYEKVKSWKELDITIRDNSKTKTEYFNYVPRLPIEKSRSEIPSAPGIKRCRTIISSTIDRIDKERHNPILTLTNVVLDTSDGDFSLTINGKEHNWISDDSIIEIANYIEEQLKNKEPDGEPAS